MFIGRNREIQDLEERYASDRFEFFVVYGRRRVGKTALINQFIQGKRAIYMMGVESNVSQNLEILSRNVLEYGVGLQAETVFSSFQAAFEYVFGLAKKERIVLAIDEYPYLAQADKSLSSVLQMLIDKNKEDSKLMLILCGSSMSFMEEEVLGYKAPLFGRRTGQLKIHPFEFSEVCDCFSDYEPKELALLYGAVGGTPQYLLQMDETLCMEDNIKRTFLNASSALYEEPENFFKQEVREPAFYNAVVTAIARGSTKNAEIVSKVGISTASCSNYLKNLMALGLIEREFPYRDTNPKNALYRVTDNMFRFWYRFVPQNSSLIARGGREAAYQRIAPHLSDYMGAVFGEICKQYLWKLQFADNCPILFQDLGRWWGTDPQTKTQIEIDIMGEEDRNTAIFAECKWRNEPVDAEVLQKLVERSGRFGYNRRYFYVFAKNGFAKGCCELAKQMGNVSLISYEEMLGVFRKKKKEEVGNGAV